VKIVKSGAILTLVTGALRALTVVPASSATYWISPYFSSQIYDYMLSGSDITTDIWDFHNIKAYESGGDSSGSIGMRTEYIDGYSKSLQWGLSSVTIERKRYTVMPWDSPYQLDRYKVYQY